MDYLKLATLFFGATGFWKLIELAVKLHMDRKLKKAQTSNLYAQAGTQIVDSWVQWSQKLEVRVKELEDKNTEMKRVIEEQKGQISKQRGRINELEKHVDRLEKRNKELEN